MNNRKTSLPGLEVTLTAHKDDNLCLLLAVLTAADNPDQSKRSPLQIALVLDRSGSMDGEKLDITKAAVAQFIRSLEPDDRVSVVTYDDRVDVLFGLQSPTEEMARRVENIEAGGSTDLYGGWVTGAKIVGRGGRVILLSDGQANAGRFTKAGALSQHAGVSYEKYGVTTTTIGVGRDYDEGIMAGMARAGGGAHYFAHTASSITDAFSQERYSAGSVILERLTVSCNGVMHQLGHFWGGETKKRIFQINDLDQLEFSIRYTDKTTGVRATQSVPVPSVFIHSEEATLEYLMSRASEAEAEMLGVRNPKSASEMKDRLRAIVLEILAHPSSDEPVVAAVIGRLKASIERLDSLERNYVEEDAMIHRKRSMQMSYNMNERAKGYSSYKDDNDLVFAQARTFVRETDASFSLIFAEDALKMATIDEWIRWEALPVEVTPGAIVVALEDPRRGFIVSEIEKQTHLKVKPVFAGVSSDEILEILRSKGQP